MRVSSHREQGVTIQRRRLGQGEGPGVGNDPQIRELRPVALVLFGQDDEAVVAGRQLLILPAAETVDQGPEPAAAILEALEAGKMDFQHLAAAVRDPGQQVHLVAEHRDCDVGADLRKLGRQRAAMPPLLGRVVQQFVQQRTAIVAFIVDSQIKLRNPRVQRERIRPPQLVGRQDRHRIAVRREPVRLVGQHPLHPGRPVESVDAVNEVHGVSVVLTWIGSCVSCR